MGWSRHVLRMRISTLIMPISSKMRKVGRKKATPIDASFEGEAKHWSHHLLQTKSHTEVMSLKMEASTKSTAEAKEKTIACLLARTSSATVRGEAVHWSCKQLQKKALTKVLCP
jgi:hypothetical protein